MQRVVALILDENVFPDTIHQHVPGALIHRMVIPALSEIIRIFPIATLPILGLLAVLSTVALHATLGLDKLENLLSRFCRHVLLESICSAMCQQLFQTTTGSLPTPEIQERLNMLAVIMTHSLEESYRMNIGEKWQNNSWSFSGVGMSVSRVLVESVLHKGAENVLQNAMPQLTSESLQDIVSIGVDFGVVTGLDSMNASVFQLLGISETAGDETESGNDQIAGFSKKMYDMIPFRKASCGQAYPNNTHTPIP
jgi:hypothetical protein